MKESKEATARSVRIVMAQYLGDDTVKAELLTSTSGCLAIVDEAMTAAEKVDPEQLRHELACQFYSFPRKLLAAMSAHLLLELHTNTTRTEATP